MNPLVSCLRWIDALNEKLAHLIAWTVLAAVVLSVATALGRKLGWGSNAMIEGQWYLFAGIFLLMSAHTLKRDEHVRIDALSRKFTPRTRAWIDLIGHLLFLLPLCVLMVSLGWDNVVQAWHLHEVSSDAGGLPRWPVLATIPLGFSLLGLQVLANAVRCVAAVIGHDLSSPNTASSSAPHPQDIDHGH